MRPEDLIQAENKLAQELIKQIQEDLAAAEQSRIFLENHRKREPFVRMLCFIAGMFFMSVGYLVYCLVVR